MLDNSDDDNVELRVYLSIKQIDLRRQNLDKKALRKKTEATVKS